jgi:hypothetical protein
LASFEAVHTRQSEQMSATGTDFLVFFCTADQVSVPGWSQDSLLESDFRIAKHDSAGTCCASSSNGKITLAHALLDRAHAHKPRQSKAKPEHEKGPCSTRFSTRLFRLV